MFLNNKYIYVSHEYINNTVKYCGLELNSQTTENGTKNGNSSLRYPPLFRSRDNTFPINMVTTGIEPTDSKAEK